MNKKTSIVLSICLLIISSVLAYFGLSYFKSAGNSYFKLSRLNTNLLQELDNSKNNYKNINEDYNSKKSRLDKINNELQKFDIISNKSNEIEDLNNKLLNSIANFQNNFFDSYYSGEIKLKNISSLNGIFIDSNLDENSIKSNLNMLPFLLNSPINSDLNQKIEKHNNKIYENLGILNYLKQGENYMIKSLLLNDSSEISNLIDEKNKIDYLVLDYYSVYKNIYSLSQNSNSFIEKLALNFDNRETESKNKNVYNTINALAIEILNSSINYLEDYNIEENNNSLTLIDINNNKFMNQNSENNKIITTYFNNVFNYEYNIVDELD